MKRFSKRGSLFSYYFYMNKEELNKSLQDSTNEYKEQYNSKIAAAKTKYDKQKKDIESKYADDEDLLKSKLDELSENFTNALNAIDKWREDSINTITEAITNKIAEQQKKIEERKQQAEKEADEANRKAKESINKADKRLTQKSTEQFKILQKAKQAILGIC